LEPGATTEDPDVRAPAEPRPHDDVAIAVAVEVRARHVHPADEAGGEGEERAERARNLAPGRAVEDPDVGRPAGSRAGHDVGRAVTLHLAHGDADAPGVNDGGRKDAHQLGLTEVVQDPTT